jgi:alpha 1,2-mannosyltransferase
MSPEPLKIPQKLSQTDQTTRSSSPPRRAYLPAMSVTPPSPTDSAVSFEFPVPKKTRARSSNELGSPLQPFEWLARGRSKRSPLRWLLAILCIGVALHLWRRPQSTIPAEWLDDSILRPPLSPSSTHHDPITWLAENSNNKHAVIDLEGRVKRGMTGRWSNRPRAAIISLVRNEELDGIMQSMRHLELYWNSKYRYPWIFFNEKPFTEEFKAATSNLTSAETFYELIPVEHWSTPSWIDQERYMTSLSYLDHIGVGKGYMLSYHQMCRWNSGFFYHHPALRNYDFYWRVEPDVQFFCNISYDVFRFMRDNALKYGFNMNILDDARSFPSLWPQTRDFILEHPDLLHPDADLEWLLDDTGNYNNCQFFSNFEIGDLNFFRAEANEKYFHHLDTLGGFYYERFGDAPIHTLSAAMFLSKAQTWFFRDIGYQHDIARHCPPRSAHRCACEPTALDENFYKLIPMESPQEKPRDSCIRAWMGGEEWVEKKEGWSMEAERAFGGDGYHGYVKDGM